MRLRNIQKSLDLCNEFLKLISYMKSYKSDLEAEIKELEYGEIDLNHIIRDNPLSASENSQIEAIRRKILRERFTCLEELSIINKIPLSEWDEMYRRVAGLKCAIEQRTEAENRIYCFRSNIIKRYSLPPKVAKKIDSKKYKI